MWVSRMVSIASGATPAAASARGSCPSVGPMLSPEPVSISAVRPADWTRNVLTLMGSGTRPPWLRTIASASAAGTLRTISSGASR